MNEIVSCMSYQALVKNLDTDQKEVDVKRTAKMRDFCVNVLEPRTNGASAFQSRVAMTSWSMWLIWNMP